MHAGLRLLGSLAHGCAGGLDSFQEQWPGSELPQMKPKQENSRDFV